VLVVQADGSVDQGALVTGPGDATSVVGQVDGRAVNLLFTVGDGRYLYGVGVAERSFAEGAQQAVDGRMGGPFVGPLVGDTGDWASCCCPSETNNFTCPENLPACRRCADQNPPPPAPTEDDMINCTTTCQNIGGGTFNDCIAACFQA
jgi:hypothetical protein